LGDTPHISLKAKNKIPMMPLLSVPASAVAGPPKNFIGVKEIIAARSPGRNVTHGDYPATAKAFIARPCRSRQKNKTLYKAVIIHSVKTTSILYLAIRKTV